MVSFAFEQPHLARAARSALTRTGHSNGMLAQGIQDASVGWHDDLHARSGQFDFEGFVVGVRFRISSEALEVHGTAGPVTRHILDFIHQSLGAAAIDMRASDGFLEDRPEIEGFRRVAVSVVDGDLPLHFGGTQFVQEGGRFWRACKVVELEAPYAFGFEGVNHRSHGCDADATGHEDEALGLFAELEQIARGAGQKRVADVRPVDQALGSPPAVIFAFDRELIEVCSARVAAQRVVAHRAIGHLNRDVSPGREAGQR